MELHHTQLGILSYPLTMWLRSHSGNVPVSTVLHYSDADPLAVTVDFLSGSALAVRWTFGRDLLIDGVTFPAGIGDVRVWPADSTLVIELDSPAGHARLSADRSDVIGFVAGTLALVPQGSELEHIDFDQILHGLAPSVPVEYPDR